MLGPYFLGPYCPLPEVVESNQFLEGPISQSKKYRGLTVNIVSKCMFGSVVAGAFQIIFRVKIHANNVFSFFKNHF